MRHFLGSIANRVFLILLAGIVVATVVTTWLASNERIRTLKDLRNQHVAERVEQIVDALDRQTPQEQETILRAAQNFGFEAQIIPDTGTLQSEGGTNLLAAIRTRLGDRKLAAQREAGCPRNEGRRGDGPIEGRGDGRVDSRPDSRGDSRGDNRPEISTDNRTEKRGDSRREGRERPETCRVIYVGLQDGRLLKLKLHIPSDLPPPLQRGRGNDSLAPYLGPYTILFLLLIAMLAYVVARMAASPIKQLATAATALGRDIDHPPLAESGPAEIRLAARAFNAMQARIRRQIQHRTHMLAAITHDLQTPLTRLRLRLEKVSDEELRARLVDDLAVMQGMVREGLDLARSMDSSEPVQRLDIDSLLASVCADATDAGHQVELRGVTRLQILGQPGALRRCLTNLLDNAIKYGQRATVECSERDDGIAIVIRDAGPGIPEDQVDAVFDAFYRVETSRSRGTGGTGLGLTIARNIAENHQASLTLRNHPDGGLEVTLVLPKAAR